MKARRADRLRVDGSHDYERIHMHALRALAELLAACAQSPVEITSDFETTTDVSGFAADIGGGTAPVAGYSA